MNTMMQMLPTRLPTITELLEQYSIGTQVRHQTLHLGIHKVLLVTSPNLKEQEWYVLPLHPVSTPGSPSSSKNGP